MQWTAVYFKPGSNWEDNPMDGTYEGWQVEAGLSEEALRKLEQRSDVPYQTYLVEILPTSALAEWETENQVKVEIHS